MEVFPMKPTETTPGRPWEKVAIDFMEFKGNTYIVIVDYYSRFIEMFNVKSIFAGELINHCKSLFARHGIPDEIYSDSGTQFNSFQWRRFAEDYDFKVTTSSPHYHQSNGDVERAVQTLKAMLGKNDDPYRALDDPSFDLQSNA